MSRVALIFDFNAKPNGNNRVDVAETILGIGESVTNVGQYVRIQLKETKATYIGNLAEQIDCWGSGWLKTDALGPRFYSINFCRVHTASGIVTLTAHISGSGYSSTIVG